MSRSTTVQSRVLTVFLAPIIHPGVQPTGSIVAIIPRQSVQPYPLQLAWISQESVTGIAAPIM